MSAAQPARRHQTLIGAGTLLVGVLIAAGAVAIPSAAGYAGVGPNFLPWVVAGALVVCGLWLIAHAWRGGWRDMEPPSGGAQGDWPALAWVAAGIVVNAVLINLLGFVLSCAACFMLAVRGLRQAEGKVHGGMRGLMLDFVTGVLIAAPAFWLFTKLLAINLPGLTHSGWI